MTAPTVQPQFEEGVTLDRFIWETTRSHPEATGQLATLFRQVSVAARLVSARVNRAGLAGMLGAAGIVNVQGEQVQKLDVYANLTFKAALEHAGCVCAIASEEDDEATYVPERFQTGRYVFVMDPLDGSSNIDVNATIGTIFGVFRRLDPGAAGPALAADLLRSGTELVAAGYVIYGSGTVIVLSTGQQVQAFTLDPMVGEFFLSHPDITLKPSAKLYSVNEGYAASWDPRLRALVESFKEPGAGWKQRYIGSLVADFHRNLLKGGVFLYPSTAASPQGKLRLLYEAFPLAFLCEAAGGSASDGRRRILDLRADTLHQRTPLFIGNRDNVAQINAALSSD